MKNFIDTGKMACLAATFTLAACSESTDVNQEIPAEIVEVEIAAEAAENSTPDNAE